MKLLNNIIYVETEPNESNFIIHPYLGDIFIVGDSEILTLKKWINEKEITCNTDKEKDFFEHLQSKKFTINNENEEQEWINKTLDIAKSYHEKQINSLNSAVFVLTYDCNFACPYCYEGEINQKPTNVLTTKMVDKIFSMYNNRIEKIALYGGEPLLPKTREIIEYIIKKAPDAEYSLTTNGFYVLEFRDILSRIKISNIMITLDGSRERHNKTRILKSDKNSGTYDKIIEGINWLLKNNICVKIRMNISESNKEDCLNLRENFIANYSAEFANGILKFELQPIFQLNSQKREELNEELVYNLYQKDRIGYYNTMAISVTPILDIFVKKNRKFIPRYAFCDAEGCRRFYDPDGEMYSCILALKNKKASIGTYYPELEFKQHSMLKRNIETVGKCQECKFRFLCGGGCANAIIDSDGDVMKPNCSILNEVYNVLPKLFKDRVSK